MNKKLFAFLVLPLFLLLFIPATYASPYSPSYENNSIVEPALEITTHINHEDEILSLPVNTSNVNEYPCWNITIYKALSYKITVDNKIMLTGVGPENTDLNLSYYINKYIDVNITIGNVIYHYKNIKIVGLPPQVGIEYVTVISYYPGQSQYLYLFSNRSGELVYPNLEIYLFSSFYLPFEVYDDGIKIDSGHILGSKTIYYNVTGNTTSLIITLGTHIYNYKNEPVARVPLRKYYAPKPAPLIYNIYQYEKGIALTILASFLSLFTSMIVIRKFVREKEATRASMIWRP